MPQSWWEWFEKRAYGSKLFNTKERIDQKVKRHVSKAGKLTVGSRPTVEIVSKKKGLPLT